jgi:hypothetical protein
VLSCCSRLEREGRARSEGLRCTRGLLVLYLLLGVAAPAQDAAPAKKLFALPDADLARPAVSCKGLPTPLELIGAYGKLPLSFEANQGQTDPRVKFFSRGQSYSLFLTGEGAVLSLRSQKSGVGSQLTRSGQWSVAGGRLRRTTDRGPRTTEAFFAPLIQNPKWQIQNAAALQPESRVASPESRLSVLRLKLVGASPLAKVAGVDELPGKSDYFIGNDPRKWRTNVPSYGKVRYEQVYPGIDLLYYGNQQQLEYDFVVSPGADPKAIALNIDGADKMEIDGQGDLVLRAGGGEVRLRKPVVYQPTADSALRERANQKSEIRNRQFLSARYALVGKNRVAFEVASYDRSLPLIIDPVLSYSTYLGGSGFDYASGIGVDSAGNVYVAGYTDSVDFPLAASAQAAGGGGACGTYPDTHPCFDAFVAKLNATGTALVYSTYFGGSGDDYSSDIAVDSYGNAYVTGYTNSIDLPTANPVQAAHGGGACGGTPCFDAFAAKLDAAGAALIYSTYLGGSADDYGQGVAVDGQGDAIISGFTASTDFPTAKALRGVHGGGTYDAFVTKLGPTGSILAYSTYLGGSGDDFGTRVAAGSAGHAYVTGYTNSADFPVANPRQATNAGGTCGAPPNSTACFDAYAAKLNVDGSALVYSTYLGGSGGDYGYGIAVDASGSAYITGSTTSTDFPVTPGAFQLAGGGTSVDAYVVKLAPTGSSAVYATYFGGLGAEAGLDIAVDSAGNAYFVGYAYGNGLPRASPLQATSGGYYDAFLTKLNSAGSALIFSTYLGGSGNEKAHGVAVDASGNAYLAGGTFSSDFPVTSSAFQTSFGSGAFDAFVAKVENLALPVLSLPEPKITFPAQGVNTTSPAYAVKLANLGDADLAISGMVASGDFAQTNNCAGAVAPGNACTLSLTFTPADLGTRSGTLTIASNAYGAPHVIDLTGTGVAAPRVTLSPASLSFADQDLGTSSAAQVITVGNAGMAVLTIGSVTAGGDFAVTHACNSSLPVEDTCKIAVVFTPSLPGTSLGAVTIADNAPGSPHLVSLTGNGLGPTAALSSFALDFGNQLVGTPSAHQTVMLNNTGNRSMEIGSIVATGDFSQTNTCGVSLPAGGKCSVNITFTPTARGSRSGSITVTDNALGSPQVVVLTGRGIVPGACSLSQTSLSFGDQRVGTSSPPQEVTVSNPGDLPLAITGIEVSGDYVRQSTCSASLAAAADCALSLAFRPTTAGLRTGTVSISHEGSDSPHILILSGTGLAPEVSFSVTGLTFGKQLVTTTSAEQTVTVNNTGSYALGIASITASGDFAQANTCGSPVPIGGACTIGVAFAPTAAGTRSGVLIIADDAPDGPHTLVLSGTGTDFSPSASPASMAIAAGQSAIYTLTVTSLEGFHQVVSLSCAGVPTGATCSISPATVTVDGASLARAAVTVATTARGSAGIRPRLRPPTSRGNSRLALLSWLLAFALVACRVADVRTRAWRALALTCLFVFSWTACAGGGGVAPAPPGGTPSGTYTLTLTATAGTVTRSVAVGLQVS